ncbi:MULTISPECIES: hypothetical protein [unclassified Blastococcus]
MDVGPPTDDRPVPTPKRSPLLELLPVLQRVAVFLPDRAGAVAVRVHPSEVDVFGPVTGLAIPALWAVVGGLTAWWGLPRRDGWVSGPVAGSRRVPRRPRGARG